MTLEQFEVGFMRDMHPESEVALWCSITAAWPYQSGNRTGMLYARFVNEGNAWALCSWDVADV